ncbi:MAG: ABC transporter permease [Chloroflexi bacterium]|nr:ABC transporter permease [Chloroflexota bacterium]
MTERSPAVALNTPRALIARELPNAKRLIIRAPLGTLGVLIFAFMGAMALLAPVVSPFDPYELHYGAEFSAPNDVFRLGTDNVGRDLLSRVIWGSRISLLVGIAATAIGQVSGGFIGLVSGYLAGKFDILVQRIMDILMAFPTMVLALALVAALGPSVVNVIIAIALVQIPRAARVIRSAALAIKQTQYVDAARSIGCTHWRILLRHVLPQCLAPFIVIFSIELPHAILIEASMSFLGLGTPPPTPSWGGMLSGVGREFVESAPWLAIWPGAAITVVVFGFNMLGDGLRDVLDPRLRT